MTGVINHKMILDLINSYVAFLMDECTVVCTLFNVVISRDILPTLFRVEVSENYTGSGFEAYLEALCGSMLLHTP